MSKRIAIVPASMLSVAILGCVMPAAAITKQQNFFENPASACQLSIPTIDTVVAPRANGYRNPGTKGAFVICGFPGLNTYLKVAAIRVFSLDGAQHTITCTGVNGSPGDAGSQAYVAKAVVIPTTGTSEIDYLPADFGDVGTIGDSAAFSITCSLPPQTGIDSIFEQYDLDVGA